MELKIQRLAKDYCHEVNRSSSLGIKTEPEAQLTIPLSNFLTNFTRIKGLGNLELFREAQLSGVRPDFASSINGHQCGWVELKAPGHTIIGKNWTGREKTQWESLSQLDSLLVTNGEKIRLYAGGTCVDECALPFPKADDWSPECLEKLINRFILAEPITVSRVSQLAERLAPLARFLRMRLNEGIEKELEPVIQARNAWNTAVYETASDDQFAGDAAQVIAYSMAITGISGKAALNNDGLISLKAAKDSLTAMNRSILAATLGPIIGIPGLTDYIAPELDAILRLVSNLDASAIQQSKDSRGEPWLWFYEDFLAKYDPDARTKSGVFYTPTSIVECQVRMVHDVLTRKFGYTLGFGSKAVVTLDPATGSGTYPLAVIDKASETALEERGPGGIPQVAENLTKNLLAFEILPGPYSVAQLRIGQRLAQSKNHYFNADELGIYLTDTLSSPAIQNAIGLFGDAKILAEAAAEAREIKDNRNITVIIGNPPYGRGTSKNGGWLTRGDKTHAALFSDIVETKYGINDSFRNQASLNNLYVYFWRWAIWKAFQQTSNKKSIISFVTASSWLDGSSFTGLRKLAATVSSDIWILDLGGDGRRADKEENVFDIKSPVAIVTLVKSGAPKRPAKIHYRRILGSRSEKFEALDRITRLEHEDNWELVDSLNGASFLPQTVDADWEKSTPLSDIFPYQQAGIKFGRLWPISPSPRVLAYRWKELLSSSDSQDRAKKFVTPRSGRNIYTKVSNLTPIGELERDAEIPRIVRVGWRSFDRQFAFGDPRLIYAERPSLWQSLSDRQIFIISPSSEKIHNGPAVTVSTAVPDLHYFCNRGGRDVIPLFKDSECEKPNITQGLISILSATLGTTITPEKLLAYCYAVTAHDGYSQRFKISLKNSPVRIPITAVPELFSKAVSLGEELLWLQTFGDRYTSQNRPPGSIPKIDGLHWVKPISQIPYDLKEVIYDSSSNELHIGDGIITNVSPEVWDFEVSGFNVLKNWLGFRTEKGIGRAAHKDATPLDLIRPTEWEDDWNDELLNLLRILTHSLELAKKQQSLLKMILSNDIVDDRTLPTPTDEERKKPSAKKGNPSQEEIDIRNSHGVYHQ